MLKGSRSPVKASNFNPLNPDLLTLHHRPNPVKILPTYAVSTTTILYPRSTTYDLWRAGSSQTIFQTVEKIIPLITTCQSGPDQPPLYFRPTYALPIVWCLILCIFKTLLRQCFETDRFQREERRDPTQSCEKAPISTENAKKQSNNTKCQLNFWLHAVIADRLRTVSWSNCNHQSGVVNRFTRPAIQLSETAVFIFKRTEILNLVRNPMTNNQSKRRGHKIQHRPLK